MSFVADIFTGGRDVENAANRAASQIQFQPFNIGGGPFGSLRATRGGFTVDPGQLATQFERPLAGGAAELLSGAISGDGGDVDLEQLDQILQGIRAPGVSPTGAAPRPTSFVTGVGPVLGPGAPGATISPTGGPASTITAGPFAGLQELRAGGRGALASSEAARQALGSFDPDAFAATQFGRLEDLARPGEETAASRAISRVFSRGRLGFREGGRQQELSELAFAQEQARNQRRLQAIGLAGQEQDRLTQQATAFGGLGRELIGAGETLGQGRSDLAFRQALASGQFGLQELESLFGQRLAGAQFGQGQAAELFGQQLASEQLRTGQRQNIFQQALAGSEFQESQRLNRFQQALQASQFGRETAFDRFRAAQTSIQSGQQRRVQDIGAALQMLQALSGFQAQPFQLLGPSIAAGSAAAGAAGERANLQFQGAAQRAQGQADFFSGLISAFNPIDFPFLGGA